MTEGESLVATTTAITAAIARPTTTTTLLPRPVWPQPPLHHYHHFHWRRHRHRYHHDHRHRLSTKPPGFSPHLRWDPGGLVACSDEISPAELPLLYLF